jgi:hypothetical protein
MSKNRITFPSELIIRDRKVGIGTSTPTSTFNVLGTAEVTGELKVTSIGSTSGEHIEVKHYRDNGGSVVYQSGDKQLFSLSNDGEFAYVISDDDGNPTLQVSNSGLTTITNLQQEDIKFLSTGSSEATRITAKHSTNNSGSLLFQSGIGATILEISPVKTDIITDFTTIRSGLTTITNLQQEDIKFLSTGSSEATRITAKHYQDNGGSVVLESGENHLFSVDNEPDIYYSINDSEARAALTVSSSGITTIRDLFQNRVNFTSVGSTSDEQIQINHYRNIAYQSDIDNRGAISFDSPTGITTDGITYFPASLFALTNGGGNVFSVSGYNWFSGSPGIPSIDVTQSGRVGFGTTNPAERLHVNSDSLITSDIDINTNLVKIRQKLGFSQSQIITSSNIIEIQPVTPGITTTVPSASVVLTTNSNNGGLNGAQLLTVENNDNTLFRVNVLGFGLTTVSSPTTPIYTVFDVDRTGEIKIFDTDVSKILSSAPGFSTTLPGDGDMFRIDTYNPPFIGTFPTVTPAIRVDKFGYTEISRNVNQISGITTVGIATTTTSLEINATMTFELINNTTLTIKVRGTDGVTRSGIVTLA